MAVDTVEFYVREKKLENVSMNLKVMEKL